MLNTYLQRAGLVTGPRFKNTSHSALEVLKKYLLGMPQFQDMPGSEVYLNFGSALHEAFLENIYGDAFSKLGPDDQAKIKAMVARLNHHPVVKLLMKDSVREEKFIVAMNGVEVAVILDGKQPPIKRGFDLKTTNAKNRKDFVKKANTMGYPRQGLTYREAAKLKQFFFVAINKTAPFDIFIYSLKDYPVELTYAEKELEFLLYFYKHYGKFQDPNKPEVPGESGNTIMAQTGKEAMAAIKELAAAHKERRKLAIAANKEVDKSQAAVVKAIGKFPQRERELYQEKLDAVTKNL